MIIHATILEVSDLADTIQIKAQGQQIGAAANAPWLTCTVLIPATATAGKTYHIGRKVAIEITPR